MNPIEGLQNALVERFPDVEMQIDAPADETGLWQLDVRLGGNAPWIVVEWKADFGFGISTPSADDYGTKPDETYPNLKAAYGRVVQLILSGGHTEPPSAVRLAELRQLCKLSQAEVAGRAGIKQAAIARIEGRGDILLSTLHRIVSALGGRLLIRVEFPDGTDRELTGLVSSPWDSPGKEKGVTGRPSPSSSQSTPGQATTVGQRTKRPKSGPKPGGPQAISNSESLTRQGEPAAKVQSNSSAEQAHKVPVKRGKPEK